MYSALYLGGGVVVRAAEPESAALGSLDRLRWLLAGLVLGGALTAAAAGRLVAARVLRPVRVLTETVERVTGAPDPTAHLDTGALEAFGGKAPARDEIGRLARSFTALMAALDVSVRTQRRLVADASHELRTPLTSLTTNLELLAEPGGLADPQAPDLLGAARGQTGELRGLINDLVDLARYGEAEAHVEDLRLDLLAADVAARAARRAPGLRFETGFEECFVRADADAVERALGNLVDNAVKWSPPGGAVRIAVTAGPQAACFSVADEGPGIPAADLPFVFDRFYRSAEARSMPGSGLGLSIVRQIADTHGGQVSAHLLERGVQLRFVMPRIV
jgi:two-component system sensor histidine kinase MprB